LDVLLVRVNVRTDALFKDRINRTYKQQPKKVHQCFQPFSADAYKNMLQIHQLIAVEITCNEQYKMQYLYEK